MQKKSYNVSSRFINREGIDGILMMVLMVLIILEEKFGNIRRKKNG